jgi:serine/threonine protein phosphatase Stp1
MPVTLSVTRWRSMFLSHRGAIRTANEDSFLEAPDAGLWAIADGMGGHQAGQVASAMIVHMLEGVLAVSSADAAEISVRERIARVNERLQALSRETYGGRTIGSTVAVLILRPDSACCLWAGDSRIYRLRGGWLERLTRDHSRTEELIAQGRLEPEQAEGHPLSNVITRAVGAQADLIIERRVEPLQASDRFLLCSDGLYRTVSDDELANILPSGDCRDAAEALMALSLSREPADNVTVGVIHVEHPDAGVVPLTP